MSQVRLFDPTLMSGLRVLDLARRYANDVGRDKWDFAVEVSALTAAGLSTSDLRWLICRDLVEHAEEVTKPRENTRRFEANGMLTFSERTCFVLSAKGRRVSAQLSPNDADEAAVERSPVAMNATGRGGRRVPQEIPSWDPEMQQLCVGEVVVKQFRLPCPNQAAVLTAFEEEGWPWRIDDPLSPLRNMVPKRRLHDTIKSLNRHQKTRLLRFRGDGTGEGVIWMFVSPDSEESLPTVSQSPKSAHRTHLLFPLLCSLEWGLTLPVF